VTGLPPLAAAVAPPRRPERARVRPRRLPIEADQAPPIGPPHLIARAAFDYSDLDAALWNAEARHAPHTPHAGATVRRRVEGVV
jgi:hypothetical protein